MGGGGATDPSPAEGPGQIVAGAERQDADGRRRTDGDLVEHRKDPADGAVAAAGQHPQVGHLAEHLQPVVVHCVAVSCVNLY